MNKKAETAKILDQFFGEENTHRELSRDEVLEIATRLQALETSKKPYELYLDNLLKYLPDEIYFKDSDSQFLLVNQKLAQSHGFDDPKQMIGKTDFDLFPYKNAVQKFADEQRIIQREEYLLGKEEFDHWEDGSTKWVSATKLPLYSESNEVIGTFGIIRDITKQKNAEEKLRQLAEELTLRNIQIEADLKMARNMQMAFIPKNYPSFIWDLSSNESALDFHHRYIPSETLAGDFFQIIPISNSQAGVFICDVMGHGVRASLVTAILRGLLGEMRMITPYPHVFLRKINRNLINVFQELDVMVFVTAFYGVFDLIKGELKYANAGHPNPVLLKRESGEGRFLEGVAETPQPALGLIDSFRYSTKSVSLSPHDLLLMFTDGLIEVENPDGKQFGAESILETIQVSNDMETSAMLDHLFEELQQFSGAERNADDMCAVGIDVKRIEKR